MRRLPLLAILALVALLALASTAGAAQKRVVNGDDAGPGEYPWTVALLETGESPLDAFCGGTLIAPRVVVTAAHCVLRDADGKHLRPNQIEVLHGKRTLTLARDESAIHPVRAIKLHPGVVNTDEDTRYDVALLVMEADVVPAGSPSIIALGSVEPSVGQALKVTGWGLKEGQQPVAVMQEAEVERRADSVCASVWAFTFDDDDQFCALRVEGSTVIDTCQGDSGGPITTIPPGTPDPTNSTGWALVGAVSYGSMSCEDPDEPGVYARLFSGSLNAFANAQIDTDLTNDPAEMAWWRTGTPALDAAATPLVGDTVGCSAGTVDFEPDAAVVTLRLRRGGTVLKEGGSGGISHTLASSDAGGRLVCEARARTPGGGNYGALRASPQSGVVAARPSTTTTTPTPATTTETPAPPPPAPPVVRPPLPGPVPVPRDGAAPAVDGFSRRCSRRRRCTLRLRIDDPLPTAGLATPAVRITSSYRTTCLRGGRRRACTKRITRTLRARRSGTTTTYLVSTGVLRRGRHTVRVFPADAAGNRRRMPFTASFSLR